MSQFAKLYNSTIWRAIRKQQLEHEPLCRMCAKDGRVKAASICDHVEPHRGDTAKFYAGPFQSLCAAHHSGDKQAYERSGRVRPRIGLDGFSVTE